MKTSVKIWLSVLIAFVVIVMTATMTLSILTMLKVNAIDDKTAAETSDDDTPGENDVTIAGQYPILSTEQISDAYLSGDAGALSGEDKETLDAAAVILDKIIRDNMSDSEKEYAVFDWMHRNIHIDGETTVLIPENPESVSRPHGVLKNKTAVCVGYATTFRLLMQMLDIPCMVVHDTNLVHSWDLVKIGESWYHVDLYSADGYADPFYYLNLPDELMRQSWDRTFYPAADSFESCYVYLHAEKIDNCCAIPKALKKALDQKTSLFSVLYPSTSDSDLSEAQYMTEMLSGALSGSPDYSDTYLDFSAAVAGDQILVTAIIQYPDDVENAKPFDDEKAEKIRSSVEDVFGEISDGYYGDYSDTDGVFSYDTDIQSIAVGDVI